MERSTYKQDLLLVNQTMENFGIPEEALTCMQQLTRMAVRVFFQRSMERVCSLPFGTCSSTFTLRYTCLLSHVFLCGSNDWTCMYGIYFPWMLMQKFPRKRMLIVKANPFDKLFDFVKSEQTLMRVAAIRLLTILCKNNSEAREAVLARDGLFELLQVQSSCCVYFHVSQNLLNYFLSPRHPLTLILSPLPVPFTFPFFLPPFL